MEDCTVIPVSNPNPGEFLEAENNRWKGIPGHRFRDLS